MGLEMEAVKTGALERGGGKTRAHLSLPSLMPLPALVPLFENISCLPISQSLVGVPGLLSLSSFSHPLYPLPGSRVGVGGGWGGKLFCLRAGAGLGIPGALTLPLPDDSTTLSELSRLSKLLPPPSPRPPTPPQ